jgi:hypothetical protein
MIKSLLSDAEAQSIIAEASNNFDPNFFYTNRSSLALDDVQLHFMTLFPSWSDERRGYEPSVLCGYENNRTCKPIAKAVFMRKINLRAIPRGYCGGDRMWYVDYPTLPPMMSFDVDENKAPDFKKLYPEYRCYEIHDKLDIPKPLVITINPVSQNCQFIYEMKWSKEDYRDVGKTMSEYEKIRRELSLLFGADPNFVNHVVRSPLFIAGHHRRNPNAKLSKKPINTEKESLYHHSIWFDPHGYTLSELREIICFLKEHLGVIKVASLPLPKPTLREFIRGDNVVVPPKQNKVPKNTKKNVVSQYYRLINTPGHKIHEGERNNWLFSHLSAFCRRMAGKYRGENGNREEFMSVAVTKANELNSSLSAPLPQTEVIATVRSVVGYCLSDRYRPLGRTSEEARFIANNFRWKNHISVTKIAAEVGVSRSTFYRRRETFYRLLDKTIGGKQAVYMVGQAMPVPVAPQMSGFVVHQKKNLLAHQEEEVDLSTPTYNTHYDKYCLILINPKLIQYRHQELRGPP